MGLLTGFTRPSAGDDLFPHYDLTSWPTNVVGSGALTANTVYLNKFRLPAARTVASVSIKMVTPGTSNIVLSIWDSDGTTWTRVAKSASTAAAGSSVIQTLALSTSLLVPPGKNYWVGIESDSTPSIGRIAWDTSLDGGYSLVISKAAITYDTTNSFTSPSAQALAPWFRLVFA